MSRRSDDAESAHSDKTLYYQVSVIRVCWVYWMTSAAWVVARAHNALSSVSSHTSEIIPNGRGLNYNIIIIGLVWSMRFVYLAVFWLHDGLKLKLKLQICIASRKVMDPV